MIKIGNIIDLENRRIFYGMIEIYSARIKMIKELGKVESGQPYIMPGFIDSHVHIESSMITPSRFGQAVLRHGTIATLSDPHEIANVMGMEGVEFMIRDAKHTPLKIYYGAPSCVPATSFETSGASLGPESVKSLLKRKEIKFLSEMMNYPGVISGDPDVRRKMDYAREFNKPIDGHAPGLTGDELKKYIKEGVKTDHECFTLEEAREKISLGMHIQIREGSAARNFKALHELIRTDTDRVMFCKDDMHPDELVKGHINLMASKAIEMGHDLFNVLRVACYNPVKFYDLDVGLLEEGDPADFIIVEDLDQFRVVESWINGEEVFSAANTRASEREFRKSVPNVYHPAIIKKEDLQIKDHGKEVLIIEALDGELITRQLRGRPASSEGFLVSDPEQDILKMVVVNRYSPDKPSVGFVKNFGLERGGIISSIAHDSHNLICLGTGDEIILELLEWINEVQGGIAFSDGKVITGLSLPVAGLMTDEDPILVSEKYKELNEKVKRAGSKLKAPFMTLSFMSLLVIPELKLSNKGLFDVNRFSFTDLYV